MTWQKASPELVATFDAVLPGPPAVRKLMFGFPAGFVNGNMFMGLFEQSMFLRLGEDDRAALREGGGTPFEAMSGRPMKQYVVVPPAMLGDRATLSSWVNKALAYGASLPPKTKKPRQRKP